MTRPVPTEIPDAGAVVGPDYAMGFDDGWRHAEETREPRGELHIWEDGKAVLTIVEGELHPEMAWAIVQGLKAANDDPKLLVFNFPVETIHEQGSIEYVGLAHKGGEA